MYEIAKMYFNDAFVYNYKNLERKNTDLFWEIIQNESQENLIIFRKSNEMMIIQRDNFQC